MPRLDVPDMNSEVQPTGVWAAALLQALVREEAAGRQPQRLTEPGLSTWSRFRGRLTSKDLVALLFEDAAVLYPIPFDCAAVGGPVDLDRLPEQVAKSWIETLSGPGQAELEFPGADYIAAQAQLLGLPTRLARSDLHVVKPHQKVLELSGTGGQLAHHLVSTQTDLTLQDNFVVACASWQEMALAGIVALDLAAPYTRFATRVGGDDLRDASHPLRQQRFDFVIGLHPDKGGRFRIEDQLAIWFDGAKCLLV